ncbi:MAG: hypothetical protein EXR27_10365 [Betaproteobacteria bacterium]|nr:hypothetical protein [Betaproteobacteria bacterium]
MSAMRSAKGVFTVFSDIFSANGKPKWLLSNSLSDFSYVRHTRAWHVLFDAGCEKTRWETSKEVIRRIPVMASGAITLAGDAAQLLADPRVREAYLGEEAGS